MANCLITGPKFGCTYPAGFNFVLGFKKFVTEAIEFDPVPFSSNRAINVTAILHPGLIAVLCYSVECLLHILTCRSFLPTRESGLYPECKISFHAPSCVASEAHMSISRSV